MTENENVNCIVPWCNHKVSYNKNGKLSDLCIRHNSICTGTLRGVVRGGWFHKLYKWEKYLRGEHMVCERCNRDCKKEYPELPGSRFLMLYDTDHIKPKKDFNKEDIHLYEHPDNYQLLCKSCHGAKSILERDYLPKRHDKLKKRKGNNLLDLTLEENQMRIKQRENRIWNE